MIRLARTCCLLALVLACATPSTVGAAVPSKGWEAEDGRYVPPTRRDGKTEVLRVTLPDGTRAELRYPRRLQLAELGLSVSASVEWDVRSDPLRCCGRILQIRRTTIDDAYAYFEPVKTFEGADGSAVPYYDVGGSVDWLVFQFGPWMVSVYNHEPGDFEDQMTDAELATWARSLDGRVDTHGYLVLRAKAPLRVEPLVEFLFGTSGHGTNFLEIANPYCGQPESDTAKRRKFPRGVAWCDPDTDWHVLAEGDSKFVRGIATGLELRRTR